MMMRSVIEIAREAGLGFFRTRDSDDTSVDALERFAAIVAEAKDKEIAALSAEIDRLQNELESAEQYNFDRS